MRERHDTVAIAAGRPPAELAAAIGFVDESHLTERFKGALV